MIILWNYKVKRNEALMYKYINLNDYDIGNHNHKLKWNSLII